MKAEAHGWRLQVFSLELRKLLAYRADFWIEFLLPTLAQLAIAYFLWGAIFHQSGSTELRGFTFKGMMLYYLLVALIDRTIQGPGWREGISGEIYQGTLTRYLIYPVSFFVYKMMSFLANMSFSCIQLALGILIFVLVFGLPLEAPLSASTVLMGFCSVFFAAILSFLMISTLDLTAFWADNVWSLQVMLKFSIQLFGGAMVPLAFYPEWARRILSFTPFPSLISLPVRSFMGKVDLQTWTNEIGILCGWIVVLWLTLHLIWSRGLRRYSATGM